MPTVVRSPKAKQDLVDIARYIAEESQNLELAFRLLDKLDEHCSLLVMQPEMGRARPELGEGIRSFPVAGFLIFYRPTEHGVEIARVLRATRDLTQGL